MTPAGGPPADFVVPVLDDHFAELEWQELPRTRAPRPPANAPLHLDDLSLDHRRLGGGALPVIRAADTSTVGFRFLAADGFPIRLGVDHMGIEWEQFNIPRPPSQQEHLSLVEAQR